MHRRLAQTIALSCAILLGVGGPEAFGQAEDTSTKVSAETEFSTYADTNDVFVYTPAVEARVEDPLDGWSFGGSYLVDIVSAASADIVSTASPAWTEVRHVGTASVGLKPDTFGATVAGSISREPDYLSLSAGGNLSLDFRQKTVTPLVGYTFTRDTAGRTGTPFSVYSLDVERHTITAALNVIVDPETALNFSADVILERGRMEKPYRYVPLFTTAAATDIPVGASAELVNETRLPGRAEERVPTRRERYAVAGRVAQRLKSTTFIIWQRGYVDSWGVVASTTDVRLVFDVSSRFLLWPHLRGHVQTDASFWQRAYVANLGVGGFVDVPALRTGDRELSPLQSFTAGAGARWDVGSDLRPSDFSLILLLDGALTHYSDALFITQRLSGFGALQFEAAFQ